MFDVVAYNVSSYLPDFDESDNKSKRLTCRLLKQSIEADPPAVKRLIPRSPQSPKKRNKKTSQNSSIALPCELIIEAAKIVADRLELLKALEHLITDHKDTLRERRELHRILAENTWVFGEQFNLTIDDESLTTALERHLHLLGRTIKDNQEVRREDGKRGIVELMLSRRVPLPRAEQREHLVIGLKRPNQKINDQGARSDGEMRTKLINFARAVTKGMGHRLPSGAAHRFAIRVREAVPEALAPAVEPLLAVLEQIEQQIAGYDAELDRLARERYPETRWLTQVPGVGTLTALTFVLTVGAPERFERTHGSVSPSRVTVT